MTTEARLRTLVALAATGSVRGAASRLTVTESAVSASIGALARELGVPLVEPVGRGLRLTASGAVYAQYARRVLGLLDEGAAAAAAELDPERGRLRLAAVTTAGEHLLPALLAEFRRQHPGIALALEVAPSTLVSRDAIADELAGGRLVQLPLPNLPMRRPWHAVVGAYSGPATGLFVRHLRSSGWRAPGSRIATSPVPAINGGTPRGARARVRSKSDVNVGGMDGSAAVEGES